MAIPIGIISMILGMLQNNQKKQQDDQNRGIDYVKKSPSQNFRIPSQQSANIQGMGQVPVAPADYYKSPEAQMGQTSQATPQASGGGFDKMGILSMAMSMMGNRQNNSVAQPINNNQNQSIIGQPQKPMGSYQPYQNNMNDLYMAFLRQQGYI